MNWFERHLNWSLFLAIYIIPFIVFGIFFLIFFVIFYGGIAAFRASGAGEAEIASYLFTTALPFVIIYFILILGDLVFDIVVTLWYLGQKARNKWLTLLLFAPFGFIILLILENQAISHGGDFVDESVTGRRPDTGQFGAPDDRQFKELDYTPNKNVLDISGSQDKKDVGDAKDAIGIGEVGAARVSDEEAIQAEKVEKRVVSAERLKMPILLDDAGAEIRCFYHPGADAVNLCSRCKQYVCNECNFVTGTHPICRNCWAKRGEVPIAPPAPKQVSPPSVKPKKQEVVEPTRPVEQEAVEPTRPVEQEVVEPTRPVEQEAVEPMQPEQQKIAAPVKSAKLDAEKSEWLPQFMALYQQASPIITIVTRRSADGMPASPLDLMEGLKLRPMLERMKKLSKPKDKELREAKNEFEQVMSNCIKIADAAADFISSGGQALLGGPDFTRIVKGIETANELVEKLSRRLASFSHPQE